MTTSSQAYLAIDVVALIPAEDAASEVLRSTAMKTLGGCLSAPSWTGAVDGKLEYGRPPSPDPMLALKVRAADTIHDAFVKFHDHGTGAEQLILDVQAALRIAYPMPR